MAHCFLVGVHVHHSMHSRSHACVRVRACVCARAHTHTREHYGAMHTPANTLGRKHSHSLRAMLEYTSFQAESSGDGGDRATRGDKDSSSDYDSDDGGKKQGVKRYACHKGPAKEGG